MGRWGGKTLGGAAALVVMALGVTAHIQAGYWQDSRVLFEHALSVTRNNFMAEFNLGCVDQKEGYADSAIAHFSAALKAWPDYDMAHYNLAVALQRQGKLNEAIAHYQETIRLKPTFTRAYNNLGIAYSKQHRFREEEAAYRSALKIDPDFDEARNNLAVALYFAGNYAAAWDEVHLLQAHGFNPHPRFLPDLTAKMPDPERAR